MPSPRSPPSPSGIQTVSTVSPSAMRIEVAFSAVDGAGGLDDLGEAYGVALGFKAVAEGWGRVVIWSRDLDALAIEGFVELRGPVAALAEALHEVGEARRGTAPKSGFGST